MQHIKLSDHTGIRGWLKRWVFTNELARLEILEGLAAKELEEARNTRDATESYKRSINITDLVREQLHGFNPRLLDTEEELIDLLEDDDSVQAFLSEAKKLSENSALPKIADFLMRSQVLESAKDAPTLDAINFGRATVNGITLVLEEIDRMRVAYEERHAEPEEFDKHEAL